MAKSKRFNFEVNDFDDVRDHLDALWYEFNKLIAVLSSRKVCGDPPNTCGFHEKPKRASRRGRRRSPVKKP
jgi:hypothetical protein